MIDCENLIINKVISKIRRGGFLSIKSKLGILTLAIAIFAVMVTYAYTIDVSYNRDVGRYLVDGSGRTLYYNGNDDAATCNFMGNRAIWPSFYTSTIDVPGELKRSDFMTIISRDGTLQTTYRNWPLYQCIDDRSSGDTKGNGSDEMQVVSPTIEFASR